MRRIDRNTTGIPECLDKAAAGQRFAQLRRAEKDEIRTSLHAIQAARCAYCERRTGTDPHDGHIEHFRCQADHPQLGLEWSNLFWSCNDESSCGKFKDKCARGGGPLAKFNPDDLINPANEDPDDFFLFVTDGTVQLKEGLSDVEEFRARETLRVFNLAGSAYLRKARGDAIEPYMKHVSWLMENVPGHLDAYVAFEQSKITDVPFSAVVRHFFRDYLS